MTTLNNLKICNENGGGEALIEKCRKLVGTFSHSTQLTESLLHDQKTANELIADKSQCKCLSLIQDVITRWNSLYLMLNCLNQLKDSIRRVFNLTVKLRE